MIFIMEVAEDIVSQCLRLTEGIGILVMNIVISITIKPVAN